MLKTKKLFDDLVIAVEKHLPEIRQLLQPPATNKDLKVLKDHLPNLPEQLMELLRCSNGQKPGTDGANLPGPKCLCRIFRLDTCCHHLVGIQARPGFTSRNRPESWIDLSLTRQVMTDNEFQFSYRGLAQQPSRWLL